MPARNCRRWWQGETRSRQVNTGNTLQYLAGDELTAMAVVAVGEPGDPGVDLRSLAGLLPLVVLSPDRRSEFWRDNPVPKR
jgi:hypothetical protein